MPLAYWGFLVYWAMAVVLAPERILNSDCSYQLFNSIQGRGFFFQEARYGMFITQVPVVAGILLHLPMKALLLLYSSGLAGTYGLCIVLSRQVFGSPQAALAIMLSLVVGVGDSFCHATTETHLLLALSGLLYASLTWLWAGARSAWRHALVALIVLWCLFTHPNALFTVGFVTLFALFSGKIKIADGLGILVLCAVYFAVRMLSLPESSYDSQQYDTLLHSSANLQRFWDLFPIWFIKQYLKNEYVAVVVILIALLVFLRPWYILLLTLSSAAVFWGITILTFPDGSGEAMMEKSFMPGVFMLALPFAALCTEHRWKHAFTILAALIMVQAFINIGMHSRYYGKRLAVLTHIFGKEGARASKILVSKADMKGTDLEFSGWATSIDALMLSRCMADTARTIFIYDGPVGKEPGLNDPGAFLYLPWQWDVPAPLDTFYFNLPRRPYQLVHVKLTPRVGRFSDS